MYITIDLGTTNLKIILWNHKGKIEKKTIFPTPISSDYTIDPLKIIHHLNDFFSNLERKYKKDIQGIAVGGMGEAGLLIDKYGNPLTPIFSWLNDKGKEEIKILESIGKKDVFYITGLKVHHKYSLAKILWLQKKEKDIWMKAYKWINAVDFINFYLSKKLVTDYSLASRMLLFDINKKTWSEEILGLCNISPEKLPDIKPTGSIIGEIDIFIKNKFSLNTFPIILGGHDHPIGSLIYNLQNSIFDSWGTAEAFILHTEKPLLKEAVRELGFSVGCIKNFYYLIAGIHFSGGILKWLKDNMKWKLIIEEYTPTNVLFFPFLLGKDSRKYKENIKAIFYGIDLNTQIKDLIKAVWEGVFYESRYILENIENLEIPIERIYLSGGMSRFKKIIKLKANILNKPIYISKEKESTSKGLALLIAENSNVENTKNFKDSPFDIISPTSSKIFEDNYIRYKKIRGLLGV
uniref:Sugar kinase n=1 Tax=Dictyoglomus thermophilum TaxID=14 RepID=A0A7C3MJN4_DICTH